MLYIFYKTTYSWLYNYTLENLYKTVFIPKFVLLLNFNLTAEMSVLNHILSEKLIVILEVNCITSYSSDTVMFTVPYNER